LVLAVQPALFLAGRSEYVATPGLALVLLALVLVTMAGRQRDWRLMIAAAAALGLVASFRALGPVVWPFCGLFFFVAKPHEPRKGIKIGVLAGLIVGLCAIPSLLRVLGVGTTYMPSEGLSLWPDFGQTQLLGDAMWTGALFGFVSLGCGLLWLLMGAKEGLYRARLAALAMFGLVWSVVYATQHVAGTYLNTPRYHLWLLVPAAVAIGFVGNLVVERARRVELACFVTGLVLVAMGLFQPWSTSLQRHPEARQLDAWRAAAAHLPKGATLYVPLRRGEHEIKLPMSELTALRPDVDLKRGALSQEAGSYAFKPLDCMRPSLSPGPSIRDDCRGFRSGWKGVDEATLGTSWIVLSEDGTQEIEASIDADYWVYPALADPPGPVGLFKR